VALQTNGVLLNEHRLAELSKHNIRVAVSIDGGAAAQDLHRRHADGRSSYAEVQRGLRLLSSERYRSIFAGLLCVIDPKVDPLASYRALMAFGPPSIDVLLPHANWETGAPSGTFGPWLVRLFDEYFDQPKKQTTIRLFDEIINLQLGGSSWSEHVGLSPAAVAVIETDGAIEQTDALKSAFPGAAATGLSVLTDSFDAALRHPGVIARQIGQKALCTTCQECGIRDICGGGHYAHRFRPGSGFLNPSVYCDDMQILIEHVGRRMQQSLGARLAMADRQAPPIG
jgi:uncharacterized protein